MSVRDAPVEVVHLRTLGCATAGVYLDRVERKASALSIVPVVLFFIAALSTNWTKPYPCLGPIWPVAVVLGLGAGIAGAAWFFVFGGHRGMSRKMVAFLLLLNFAFALIAGVYTFAPFLNAALDFGPETTAMGTIQVIKQEGTRTSRFARTRSVTTVVDGREREGSFAPSEFWDVAAVRDGGPVRLTVRPGFFGIPWIEKFSDP